MRRIKSHLLSARQAKELLEKRDYTIAGPMSPNSTIQVLLLPNGAAVLMLPGRPRYFESATEFWQARAEAEQLAGGGPTHIASALPYGREFVKHVDALVQRLSSVVPVKQTALDRSDVSLRALDRAIRKLDWELLLTGEVLGPVVAYLGEVIRTRTGGAWEMRLGTDGKTWEPWIVDAEAREYAPFMFAKELHEYGPKASALAFVGGTIGSFGLAQ
jgi:hypothetical protein